MYTSYPEQAFAVFYYHNVYINCYRYMLQYFEERGFRFRELDESSQSPLHCVCSFGHLEAFKYLLRKGVCMIVPKLMIFLSILNLCD